MAMIRLLVFKTPPMRKIYDIVILTEARFTDEKSEGNSNTTVYLEDQLIREALIEKGLKTIRLSWDDQNFDWSTTKHILFRSTWDYFYRFPEFSKWLRKVSQQTNLLNSEAIIRWNLDKHYLLDLEGQGVRIARTHFIEQGINSTLKALHQELGWADTVLKPCISGTARHTYRLNPENLEDHEVIFNRGGRAPPSLARTQGPRPGDRKDDPAGAVLSDPHPSSYHPHRHLHRLPQVLRRGARMA